MLSSTKTSCVHGKNAKGIKVTPNFEREVGLTAYKVWMNKKDRHPY